MGDAEFGFPAFSLESDPFFEAIVNLRRDTEYTAHLFESYSHLRPPQSAAVPAQIAAAAAVVDGTAAAAAAAAAKAVKDAKRKADADAKALKAKRQKEAARKAAAAGAGGAGAGTNRRQYADQHSDKVTIGDLSDKVNISGDIITVLYQPLAKNGVVQNEMTIKKSISKMDAAFAAHGENPIACKSCYVVRSRNRLQYCNNAQHADHATPTSPAHVFKLDQDARVALCRECGLGP